MTCFRSSPPSRRDARCPPGVAAQGPSRPWATVPMAGAVVMALALSLGAAPTQAATDGEADWTGAQQSPADARKEAAAALVEGRRECARVSDKGERSACFKLVEADHAATLKRLAPARPAPKR